MKKILSIFNKESKLNIFGILLISILPAALLSRSAVLNVLILIINFFFLFIIIREKKLNFFNNKYFYALLIFWISYNIENLSGTSSIISFVLNLLLVAVILGFWAPCIWHTKIYGC